MTGRRFVLLLPILVACGASPAPAPAARNDVARPAPTPTAADAKPAPTASPLLPEWTGPYGGVPPFGRVTVADMKPALDAAMADKLANVERIAADTSPPTFDNTVAALERAGKMLDRVSAVYNIYTSTMNDDAMQSVQREMAPKLAALRDKILQNSRLFQRISAVYAVREASGLTPEQQRLVWLDFTNFSRTGAKLDDAAKKKLFDMNQRLAALYTAFSQNVLAEEGTQMLVLEKEADLAGLTPELRDSAAAAAAARGKSGQWAIVNTRSSVDPFLTYSTRRDLREKAWRMFTMRGDNGDAHDNNQNIAEILKLRAERAQLLGYPTHAHWRLEDSMAKTPERAMQLMEAVWKPAVARVHEEVADMQAIADKEGAGITIEPWDYRYYAEKVRKAKFDLDQNLVRPYLQLDKMREAMFYTAGELFGLSFKQLSGIPLVQEDEQVYEVTDKAGKHVGLWYFDRYARPGKRSGAWMNAYRR
jgi:peptidyl-dipeptidase Dcp